MQNTERLNVREFKASDIPIWASYWCDATDDFLLGMGVDLKKRPTEKELVAMIESQLSLPIDERQSYALIWEIDTIPVGHCNVGDIVFGEKANMHLHMWQATTRKKGFGLELARRSIPFFFKNLQLRVLYCEPYALNAAPNKTLPKLNFEFVKKYSTIPGPLCFEQEVNQYRMCLDQFKKHYHYGT